MLGIALKLAPMLVERIVARVAPVLQFKPDPQPPTMGNLFTPIGPYSVGGGWKSYWAERATRLFRPASANVQTQDTPPKRPSRPEGRAEAD